MASFRLPHDVSRVLLTGGNGFVGAHILAQLLDRGASVRSVVRSQAKADQVRADHPTANEALDFGIVPDITSPGAYNEVVRSDPTFDTVIHTASPFLYRAIHNNLEFLEPALHGTTEILKAIKAFAPTVTRVIITSSFAAVFNPSLPPNEGKVYTYEEWLPVTWEEALSGTPGTAYLASKKFAEKAAWDFATMEKPNFDVVVFNPPMVYGPLRHSISNTSDLNESNARIYNLFINSSASADLPLNGFHVYVDVRDLARAHVQAALEHTGPSTRYLISAGQISSQEISDILRLRFPELLERTPKGEPGVSSLPSGAFNIDARPVREAFRLEFRSAKSTFEDLGEQLLYLEGGRKE